jgi:PTH1 family peptidyl-tRNA hydrolase
MFIFGLGNPGIKYRSTRHNVGALFCQRFARHHKKRFRLKRGYQIATVHIAGTDVHLIKPQVWMNQSGLAVTRIVRTQKEPFLVAIDDVNLPLGRMRLRSKGSDGGHLGLRSIGERLETTNFPRLRIGIGRADADVASYVLDTFSRHEKRLLHKVVDEAVKGIEIMIKKDFVKAQNHINAVDLTTKPEALNTKL